MVVMLMPMLMMVVDGGINDGNDGNSDNGGGGGDFKLLDCFELQVCWPPLLIGHSDIQAILSECATFHGFFSKSPYTRWIQINQTDSLRGWEDRCSELWQWQVGQFWRLIKSLPQTLPWILIAVVIPGIGQ